MKPYRLQRLNHELKKILNVTLSQKINDSRLDWVSITDVEISKDLKYLKVYFSYYKNPQTPKEIKEHLIRASGFFKKQIAGVQLMRTIPELTFHYDETAERASKIDSLLASVKDEFDDEDGFDEDINIDEYLDDDDFIDIEDDEDDYEDFDEDTDEDI